MGCGCGKKAANMDAFNAVTTPSSDVYTHERNESTVIRDVPTREVDGPCFEKADILRILNNKIVELYDKFRPFDGPKALGYVEIQKKIRGWQQKLNEECPDESEFSIVMSKVNSDYALYV